MQCRSVGGDGVGGVFVGSRSRRSSRSSSSSSSSSCSPGEQPQHLQGDVDVTARVWCRGRIDRKRNSTINLTTDSGACY